MCPASRGSTFIPPWKDARLNRESESAGSDVRMESGSVSRLWLMMVSESISTVILGKLFQKISSTRFTLSSPLIYSEACFSTNGVSLAGVKNHMIAVHRIRNNPVTIPAIMAIHFAIRFKVRFIMFAVFGCMCGAGVLSRVLFSCGYVETSLFVLIFDITPPLLPHGEDHLAEEVFHVFLCAWCRH